MTVRTQEKKSLQVQIHILTHRLAINSVMNVEALAELTLVLPTNKTLTQILPADLTYSANGYNAVAEFPPLLAGTKEIFQVRSPRRIRIYFSATASTHSLLLDDDSVF